MKRIILSLTAAFLCVLTSNAVITQQVVLKNGSVLYGYIQKQDTKGNIAFCTEKAIISLDEKNVESITNERTYKLSDIGPKWKEWAIQNNFVQKNDRNGSLMLCDVIVKEDDDLYVTVDSVAVEEDTEETSDNNTAIKNAYKVRILERGKTVKYLELTPNVYNIKRSDIAVIKAEKRDKSLLSGINRIYTLKNGREVEGEYAGETLTTLSLFVNGNIIETFETGDVIKYTYRPINPQQSIFEQSQLTDIVRKKNGSRIRGIIIEQNYAGKTNAENYMLVQQLSGGIQSIKVSDISEICREENTRYSPKEDIILKNGEVMINRIAAVEVNISEDNDMLLIDSIDKRITITGRNNAEAAVKTISVEYNSANGMRTNRFQLVKVKDIKKKREILYGFSYKDLAVTSVRPSKEETSINNTTRIEYKLNGNGIFVLYDTRNRTAFPFEIK